MLVTTIDEVYLCAFQMGITKVSSIGGELSFLHYERKRNMYD